MENVCSPVSPLGSFERSRQPRAGCINVRGYVYNQRYPCLTGHTHHAKDRLACWVVRFNFKCFFCLDASSLPVSASPLWHIYASSRLVVPSTAYELHRAGLSSMSRVAVSVLCGIRRRAGIFLPQGTDGWREDALVEPCRFVCHCSSVLSMDALAVSNAFLISALE